MSIERKFLEFTFDIDNVQFNHLGSFFLKLSVVSLHSKSQHSRIRVRKNAELYVAEYACITDVVKQEEPKVFYQFVDHKFSFFLPKGLCKNDTSHDVYLLVEAFECSSDPTGPGKRVGEAKFAIYPRTNAPRVNLYAPPEADMYNTTAVMTLLRTLSTDNMQMHCGRLKYTASFRELLRPPREVTDISPTPIEDTPRPIPSSRRMLTPPPPSPPSPSERSLTPDSPLPGRLTLPRSPTPEFESLRKIPESPLGHTDQRSRPSGLPSVSPSHVSRPGSEEIIIIMHGAVNLPALPDGSPPLPFVAARTQSDEDRGLKAQGVTHATIEPTHSPAWEEVIGVGYDQYNMIDEVLVLDIADCLTKQVLTSYRLPVSHLKPFHQYHLEMVMPSRGVMTGVRLFATLLRKSSTLPRDLSSPNYVGLEVLLQGVEEKLDNPVGPVIAVARVVPDFYSYRQDMLSGASNSAGITMMTVSFPSPHPALFSVPPQHSQGYPQVSLPGRPEEQPEWNHAYFFSHHRDKATLFTPGAALVVELYQATAAMSDMSWRVRSAIGFSSLVLDQHVYRQLSANGAKMGLRVDRLPVQGTSLKTVTGTNKTPTLGCVLRLLVNERPDTLAAVSDPEMLPVLDATYPGGESDFYRSGPSDLNLDDIPPADDTGVKSLPQTPSPIPVLSRSLRNKAKKPVLPIQDGELPPHDALENILPEYQYIFVDPHRKKYAPGQSLANGTGSGRLPEDLDRTSLGIVDYQMRELEKYRTAVHKMGQDILSLRQQIRDMETHNSQLRRDLANYNDATRLLMDSQELDGLTKPELAARYVTVKQRLSKQTSELRDYKQRVQTLQNDLIRKNEREKDYLRMSHAHQSQNELLQRLQDRSDKVRKLEDVCKKQEKVIDKQEKLLNRGPSSNKGNSEKNAINDALMEENSRLRMQLADMKDQKYHYPPPDDRDKLQLYEKIERSEGRIMSLEKQLAENARRWGREKSDLLTRLQEADHGFRRTSPLDKDFPYINTTRSYDSSFKDEPRRYSKAPRKGRYGSPKLDPLRT